MRPGPLARNIFLSCITLVQAVICLSAEGFVLSELFRSEQNERFEKLTSAGNEVIVLSGDWECTFEEETIPCRIPCSYRGSAKTVIFRRSFLIADSFSTMDWELIIPSFRYHLDLYINGNLINSDRGNYSEFRATLQNEHLRFGAPNEIVLDLRNDLNRSTSVPLRPGLFEAKEFYGIFSDVYLVGRRGWSLHELDYVYDLNNSSKDSSSVQLRVATEISESRIAHLDTMLLNLDSDDLQVFVWLSGDSGETIARVNIPVEEYRLSSHSHPVAFPEFAAKIWSPGFPQQYLLEAALINKLDTLSYWSREIGFRRSQFSGQSLEVNHIVSRLRIVDYICQGEPGVPASTEMIRSDLERLLSIGLNAVRIQSGSPLETILTLTDSLGVLVLLECGVTRIPEPFLTADYSSKLQAGPIKQAFRAAANHPSVVAIGAGSLLDFSGNRTSEFVNKTCDAVRQILKLPCYLETVSGLPETLHPDFVMRSRRPYDRSFQVASDSTDRHVIYSNLGWLSEFGRSDRDSTILPASQLFVLSEQFSQLEMKGSDSGFAFHSFSDYQGAVPLISASTAGSMGYSYGLYSSSRREKPTVSYLREYLSGEKTDPSEAPSMPAVTRAVIFPVVALAALLILSISIRGNNVFYQNLRRVFRHAHGFFSDIRFRRYLQSSQALLLWLLSSVSIALLIASILYGSRDSLRFDYFLSFVGISSELKTVLIRVIWSPWELLSWIFGIVLFLFPLHAVFLKLFSKLFRPRISLNQIWNYVIWSQASLLFFLPLGAILYRLLDIDFFVVPVYIILTIGLLWSWFRLMKSLQNGFQTSLILIGSLFILSTGTVACLVYFAADHWLYFPEYWHWMNQVYFTN